MVVDPWEDHCVECGEPECFKTCPKFRRGAHGRCERVLMRGEDGIKFLEWGKLELLGGMDQEMESSPGAVGEVLPVDAWMDSAALRQRAVRNIQKHKVAGMENACGRTDRPHDVARRGEVRRTRCRVGIRGSRRRSEHSRISCGDGGFGIAHDRDRIAEGA